MKRLILAATIALATAPMASALSPTIPLVFNSPPPPVIGTGIGTGIIIGQPYAPTAEGQSCGANFMQTFVGQPLSYAFATDAAIGARILRPGTMVTMQYDAERRNIHVDENDMITRIACG